MTDVTNDSPWPYKPNAQLLAGWVTTEEELDELFQFCRDNPLPRWLFHPDSPPHPTRAQFSFYFDRGNPIAFVRDQDGELWGWSIRSRQDGRILWIHPRREADELHDKTAEGMEGYGANTRQVVAHMNALTRTRFPNYEPYIEPIENGRVAKIRQDDAKRGRPSTKTLTYDLDAFYAQG